MTRALPVSRLKEGTMMERHNRILDLIIQNRRMSVAELSDILKVSQVTVRKDLDTLSARGLLRREHGVAVFDSSDNVETRMAYHYELKRRIAKAAADQVDEGETVMIESGSCCALLAEELTTTKPGVIIVTNSVFIASHVRSAPYGRVILLGGEYQKESQVLVGPLTRKAAEVFFSDKFFIGAGGFCEKFGFTGPDHQRAQTVRDMAEQAGEIIVLTESEKFLHQGVEGVVRTEDVSKVYTDENIPKNIENFLTKKNVLVHKVSLASPENEGAAVPAAAM